MKTTAVILLFLSFAVVSCGKKEEPMTQKDSVMVRPIAPAKDTVLQDGSDPKTGLVIDRARMRTPEHQKLLNRFSPPQVVNIYHDFKPLRKADLKQEQIDAYLKQKKITIEELKAILEEGDLLGWSKQ